MKLFNVVFSFGCCVCVVTCAQPIKRQAHFLPVFEGRVLLSGKPRFIDSASPPAYTTPEIDPLPESLETQRLEDGSVLVAWITSSKRPEKLMFIDSGVYPVLVPDFAIQETTDLNGELPLGEPFVLRGFGGNTAFVRDFIRLGDVVQ